MERALRVYSPQVAVSRSALAKRGIHSQALVEDLTSGGYSVEQKVQGLRSEHEFIAPAPQPEAASFQALGDNNEAGAVPQ